MIRALAAVLLLLAALPAGAAEEKSSTRILGGYVSGRDFMDMDGQEKRAYLTGMLEGMFLAPAFGAKNEDLDWLVACTAEVGIDDVRRHAFEYVRERFDLWDNRSPVKIYRAVRELCLARAKKAAPPEAKP